MYQEQQQERGRLFNKRETSVSAMGFPQQSAHKEYYIGGTWEYPENSTPNLVTNLEFATYIAFVYRKQLT